MTLANLVTPVPVRNASVPITYGRHLKLLIDTYNCRLTVVNPIQSVLNFITVD